MRFAVLGPLVVQREDGEPVSVAGAKERLLLAVLTAASPAAVSTDRLLELLWNGSAPTTARKSFQAHVVRLRSALEPERPRGSSGRYVVRRGPGYALAVDREDIDTLTFTNLTTRGRARLGAGDAHGAMEQLSAAVDLWRGEPYADWPDLAFADVERRRLTEVRAAANEGLVETRLALGRHAEVIPELEALVAEDPLRETWWSLLMLALYRSGRQADALAAGRRARAVLTEELGADPGPGLRAVETAVLQQDPSLDLPKQRRSDQSISVSGSGPSTAEPTVGGCPFKGLAVYQAEDASLFRGRSRLVRSLVRHLVDNRLLVLSGPSGAGKSSVARAGMIPALADGALPGSERWRPMVVSPGPRPVDSIASLTGESPPEAPVLLVCDQFEQLWAPGRDPAERSAFLDAVLGLLDDGLVARCVAVVRGDHVGRLAEHSSWSDLLAASLVLVPPMTDGELREVVTEPARTGGLTVEPELLDVVVADVLGQVGALPLLSTALAGTWERRTGDRLTVGGYLAAGGVQGALARSAEAAYLALDDDAREVAHRLLVRLADSEESGVVVRRPVPLAELPFDGPESRSWRLVMESFVSRRLLAVDGDRLEVAHEALLIAWPRLARWLEDDAAGRAVRRQLAPAALSWDAAGRPLDELYRGARLAGALEWAESRPGDLTPVERDFVDDSREQADAELRAADERAEREAAGRRRTRHLAAGLAAVLAFALVAAGVALHFQRAADARATEAGANRLAALSGTVEKGDVALLLAAQAFRLADTPETRDGLLAALSESSPQLKETHWGLRSWGSELGGNGRWLFVHTDETVIAWDLKSRERPRTVALPGSGEWVTLSASPTAGLVAIGGNPSSIVQQNRAPWVRINDSEGNRRVWLEHGELSGALTATQFSTDGLRLLVLTGGQFRHGRSAGWDWRVHSVDVASGAVADTGVHGHFAGIEDGPILADFAEDASAVTVWPEDAPERVTLVDMSDGSQRPLAVQRRASDTDYFWTLPTGAAQLWNDGSVTLYDTAGRIAQVLGGDSQDVINDIEVSDDQSWAVTTRDGGQVEQWHIDRSSGLWSPQTQLRGHVDDVGSAELGPGSRVLFTVSSDGTGIAWDMSGGAGFGSSYPALDGHWISNRPHSVVPGEVIVAPTRVTSATGADNDEPARNTRRVAAAFIDPRTGRALDYVDVGTTLACDRSGSSIAVSPDRRFVAVTSGFATTVLDARSHGVLARVALPHTPTVYDACREPMPHEVVWSAGWTPDGRLLIGAEGKFGLSGDGGLVVVDPDTWRPVRRIDLHDAPRVIETSPDGRALAIASADRPVVQVLDAATLQPQRTLQLRDKSVVNDMSFSADGRWLALGHDAGRLEIVDTQSWRAANEPQKVHSKPILQVEWLDDGRTVATTGLDGTVSLFDTQRHLARSRQMAGSNAATDGHTYLVPDVQDSLIVLSGDRPGRRYPMSPAAWLADACATVGRDLSRTEWQSYLPGRAYEHTCTPLL